MDSGFLSLAGRAPVSGNEGFAGQDEILLLAIDAGERERLLAKMLDL
jgi:hypothetical protein